MPTDADAKREAWQDVEPIVNEKRDGWEVEKAVELFTAGEMVVEGRVYTVTDIDPEIGFIECRLEAGSESYFTEIRWTDTLGYRVEMHSSNVEIENNE